MIGDKKMNNKKNNDKYFTLIDDKNSEAIKILNTLSDLHKQRISHVQDKRYHNKMIFQCTNKINEIMEKLEP